MQSFFDSWQDYNNLSGLIRNSDDSLDDEDEQDLFIANSLHPDFLKRHVTIDCKDPTKDDDFTMTNLVSTLENYLLQLPTTQRRLPNPYRRHRLPTTSSSINQVSLTDTYDIPSTDLEDAFDDDTSDDDFPAIDTYILQATVNNIKSRPDVEHIINRSPCIICQHVAPENADHPFSDCPMLKSHPHCRRVYITCMNTLNRIIKEQRRHLSDATRTATINQIIASIETAAKQDFQEGNTDEE